MSDKKFVLTQKGSISFEGNIIRKNEQIEEAEVKKLPKRLQSFFEPYKEDQKPVDAMKSLEKANAALELKVADLQKINSEQQKKIETMRKQIEEMSAPEPENEPGKKEKPHASPKASQGK